MSELNGGGSEVRGGSEVSSSEVREAPAAETGGEASEATREAVNEQANEAGGFDDYIVELPVECQEWCSEEETIKTDSYYEIDETQFYNDENINENDSVGIIDDENAVNNNQGEKHQSKIWPIVGLAATLFNAGGPIAENRIPELNTYVELANITNNVVEEICDPISKKKEEEWERDRKNSSNGLISGD